MIATSNAIENPGTMTINKNESIHDDISCRKQQHTDQIVLHNDYKSCNAWIEVVSWPNKWDKSGEYQAYSLHKDRKQPFVAHLWVVDCWQNLDQQIQHDKRQSWQWQSLKWKWHWQVTCGMLLLSMLVHLIPCVIDPSIPYTILKSQVKRTQKAEAWNIQEK